MSIEYTDQMVDIVVQMLETNSGLTTRGEPKVGEIEDRLTLQGVDLNLNTTDRDALTELARKRIDKAEAARGNEAKKAQAARDKAEAKGDPVQPESTRPMPADVDKPDVISGEVKLLKGQGRRVMGHRFVKARADTISNKALLRKCASNHTVFRVTLNRTGDAKSDE